MHERQRHRRRRRPSVPIVYSHVYMRLTGDGNVRRRSGSRTPFQIRNAEAPSPFFSGGRRRQGGAFRAIPRGSKAAGKAPVPFARQFLGNENLTTLQSRPAIIAAGKAIRTEQPKDFSGWTDG